MTKLKTLITTILVALSTTAAVASAHPAQGYDGGSYSYGYNYNAPSRDHRTPDYGVNVDARFSWNDGREVDPGYVRRYPEPQPVVMPTPGIACGADGRPWTALTEQIDAIGDRQFVHLSGAPVGSLRLQMQDGGAYVIEIGVIFHGGRTAKIMVNRWMRAGDSTTILDLGRMRNVDGLVVYTADGGNGAYQIIGA